MEVLYQFEEDSVGDSLATKAYKAQQKLAKEAEKRASAAHAADKLANEATAQEGVMLPASIDDAVLTNAAEERHLKRLVTGELLPQSRQKWIAALWKIRHWENHTSSPVGGFTGVSACGCLR